MKNLLLIAATILAVGCGGKNQTTDETKPPEIEKEELPPIPDKVTKEFVMALWDQPNDETDLIKEIENHGKSGIWTISRKVGPSKNELVNTQQAKFTSKFANQRYVVWEFITDTSTSYSALTYDFEKEKYHWWEFGEESGSAFAAEYSGQLLDGNLIEWESVIFPYDGVKIRMKEISKTAEKIVMTGEMSKDGKIVTAIKDIMTWSEELPTEKDKAINE